MNWKRLLCGIWSRGYVTDASIIKPLTLVERTRTAKKALDTVGGDSSDHVTATDMPLGLAKAKTTSPEGRFNADTATVLDISDTIECLSNRPDKTTFSIHSVVVNYWLTWLLLISGPIVQTTYANTRLLKNKLFKRAFYSWTMTFI